MIIFSNVEYIVKIDDVNGIMVGRMEGRKQGSREAYETRNAVSLLMNFDCGSYAVILQE